MAWLKLDDGMGEHRKTRRLLKRQSGLGAFGLHALALLHCAKYLTDGLVDEDFIDDVEHMTRTKRSQLDRMIAGLVDCGQWVTLKDGWLVNSYLDHNPTRADVEDRRRKRAEAGAKGGLASGQSRREANASTMLNPVPSRPTPVPSHTDNESSTATQPLRASDEVEALRAVS